MATTSTNKQPLLVDRVFHEIVGTNFSYNSGIDIVGTNSAALLLNCIGSDGAIVEYAYLISRGAVEYTINFYLSTNNDYLRPSEAFFIGQVKSETTAAETSELTLPKCMTPVPQHTDIKNTGLYVPANKALWVARDGSTDVTDAPLAGVQGGFF